MTRSNNKWIRTNGRLQLKSQRLGNNVKNTVLRIPFYVLFFSGPIFLYLLDVTLGTREVNNTSRFSDRKNHPLSLNLIDIKRLYFSNFILVHEVVWKIKSQGISVKWMLKSHSLIDHDLLRVMQCSDCVLSTWNKTKQK